MGIILLADSVEPSSRSLDEPTPSKFRNVVQTIVKRSMEDDQLSECPITIRELEMIKESFTATLTSMHHNRISYPGYDFGEKRNGNGDPEKKAVPDS